MTRRRGRTNEDLLKQIEAGDPDAINFSWRLVGRILEITTEKIDRGELSLSQLFGILRDTNEFEQRHGPYADWFEDWRVRNPELAEGCDERRHRVLAKLQAKARDGTLEQWCRRHRLNPAAVADFAWGGDARSSRRN